MDSKKFSKIYEELTEANKARYVEKLRRVAEDSVDPYVARSEYLREDQLPRVDYPDIYNFLINAPSPYTKDQLKGYRNLDGHKYHLAGWVGDVRGFLASESQSQNVFVSAKVRHSQSVSSAPAQPWIAAEVDGTVLCAHCTCMAGLGESCSHVAALLFSLYARTQMIRSTASTSLPCQWSAPSMKDVEYARVRDIDFTSPAARQHGLKRRKSEGKYGNAEIAGPSGSELESLYDRLAAAGKPSLLSLTPSHCERYVPTKPQGLPPLMPSLFNPDMLGVTYDQLLSHCDSIFPAVSVSEEEAKMVELATRDQARSEAWFNFRAGRITASKLKSAVRTDISQPSSSLVRSVCYPEAYKFSSKATRWGCDHERTAIDHYRDVAGTLHTALRTADSGFVIHPKYPYLGATPDSLVECSCCGLGVEEVKCPFGCQDANLSDAADSGKLCLEKIDGALHLKRDHQYYYQIQLQMLVCQVQYCDFLLWNEKGLFIERVSREKEFIDASVAAACQFFKFAVLPELVGKWFTKTFTSLPATAQSCASATVASSACGDDSAIASEPPLWCYCRESQEGEVVRCSADGCQIRMFHLVSLKLKCKPKRKNWTCPDCRKLAARKNTSGSSCLSKNPPQNDQQHPPVDKLLQS